MNQGGETRREYFRLAFEGLAGSMEIFEVDMNPVSVEPRAIEIFDLGGGGIYFRTDVDLPIRHGVYATFTFALQGQSFSLRGRFARKTDDTLYFWYGVTFVDVEEAERETLISALHRVQIERSRQQKPLQT